MSIPSDAVILATVCQHIQENVINPPIIDANTRLNDLVYKRSSTASINPIGKEVLPWMSTAYSLVRTFVSTIKISWILPDNFRIADIHTVADFCKLIKDGYEKLARIEAEHQRREAQKIALALQLKNVAEIEIDDLLNGTPSWEEVVKFFLLGDEEGWGGFDNENQIVRAIRRYFLTPEQKVILANLRLSIEDCLNGRYGDEAQIDAMFQQWNTKLGFYEFGSDR